MRNVTGLLLITLEYSEGMIVNYLFYKLFWSGEMSKSVVSAEKGVNKCVYYTSISTLHSWSSCATHSRWIDCCFLGENAEEFVSSFFAAILNCGWTGCVFLQGNPSTLEKYSLHCSIIIVCICLLSMPSQIEWILHFWGEKNLGQDDWRVNFSDKLF